MLNRKTIGVIMDTMDGRYQTNIANNLKKTSQHHDMHLLFFSGVALDSPEENEQQHNTIFSLPNTEMLDGIILVLSSLENYSGQDGVEKLSARFKDVPIISISIPVGGALNIMLDNMKSMDIMFEHMLKHHEMKDIAFISGPMKNYEAINRHKAYMARLEANGLEYNEAKVYEGNFFDDSGKAAVDYFARHNEKMPRGIVAANDEMAIGAYLRLTELGYRIPEDVAITGFDNIDTAQDFFPPFTTFDQRTSHMSQVAIEQMIEMIEGRTLPGVCLTVGNIIVRESCGCLAVGSDFTSIRDIVEEKDLGLDETLSRFSRRVEVDRFLEIIEIILTTMSPEDDKIKIYKDYAQSLVVDLVKDLRDGKVNGEFVKGLNRMANFTILNANRDCELQELAVGLRSIFLELTSHPILIQNIEDIMFLADTLMGESMRRKERHHQFHFRRMYLMSRKVVQDMNRATSFTEIYKTLNKSMDLYGISQCYVSLYKRPLEYTGLGNFIYPMMSELVYGYDHGRKLDTQYYVTNTMLPHQIINQENNTPLIFLSLFSGLTQYGFIVFSADGIDPMIYETLRGQVSEALNRQQITNKRLEAERALNNVLREIELSNELLRKQSVRDELTGIYNRRGFYIESEAYFKNAALTSEPFYVIFADIDSLKSINDRFGHDEGDFAIKKITHTVSEVLSSNSIFARMSGDEFTVLIKNTSVEMEIKDVILTIKRKLDQFNNLKIKPYKLSLSLGYARYNYELQSTMDDLLKMADSNLYREKARKNSIK